MPDRVREMPDPAVVDEKPWYQDTILQMQYTDGRQTWWAVAREVV